MDEQFKIVEIPSDYVPTYENIMFLLADYGIEMLHDCRASCTNRNSNVLECFNMFHSALANYRVGKEKEANVIIKYIDAKINQLRQK